MESSPVPAVTEHQNHENSDNQVSAISIEFQKEANCRTTSNQKYYGVSQPLENNEITNSKDGIGNEMFATIPLKIAEHNSTCRTFDNESISSVKESGTGNSGASTSSGSLNSNLNILKSFQSSSKKLSDQFEPYYENPGPSSSPDDFKRRKVELYGPDEGPKIYHIKGNLVTPPIIAKNLPKCFNSLPIYGKPEPNEDMEKFYSNKIREFVGFDLNDEQFENLSKFCSPEHLKTGKELKMTVPFPTLTVLSVFDNKEYDGEESQLCVVKKHRLRMQKDPTNNYQKKLKYRGIRLMPLVQAEEEGAEVRDRDLEPGKDLIYHVRIYRPFPYNIKEKLVSSRHSVFSRDVVLSGRQRLSALRDRVVCANDVSMRVDASDRPDDLPPTSAKELFPSGFLFINNVLYVDARGGCEDRTAPLRAWAAARGLGHLPHRDLHATTLQDIHVRLGHPEVYVHQGNCEHLFTFSEIRLLNPDDPLSSSHYPTHTALSQNQSVYCTTCAEFGAKWIVVGCSTVPFDPAYFCETCFKMYLYKDGKKIGDFKAYAYRGNELNMLKTGG